VSWITDLCLDHVWTIASHFQNRSKYVDGALALNVLQKPVDENERSSSADASTKHTPTSLSRWQKITDNASKLVAWSSGITSVFGRHAFAVLRSTCSWWVITYVGKPSAIGQPTRPTQPFILSGSINEQWAAIGCPLPQLLWWWHLVNAHQGKVGMVLFAGKTAWSMPERFECTTWVTKVLYKYSAFPSFFQQH